MSILSCQNNVNKSISVKYDSGNRQIQLCDFDSSLVQTLRRRYCDSAFAGKFSGYLTLFYCALYSALLFCLLLYSTQHYSTPEYTTALNNSLSYNLQRIAQNIGNKTRKLIMTIILSTKKMLYRGE
jgi:hypothetical protein